MAKNRQPYTIGVSPMRQSQLLLAVLFTFALSGCRESPKVDSGSTSGTSAEPRTKVTAINSGAPGSASGRTTKSTQTQPKTTPPHDDSDLQGPDPKVLVTGRVTLTDGSPASSATLTLQGYGETATGWATQDAGHAVTAEDGTYRLVGQGMRSHSLRAEHEQGGSVIVSLKEADQRWDLEKPLPQLRKFTQDLTLGATAAIRGRIVDEKDQPIAGASISFVGDTLDQSKGLRSADGIATSTTTGEFVLGNVVPGQRTLMVSSDNHVAASQLVTAPTTEDVLIKLQSAGAMVQGHVLLKNSSTPVTSATVSLTYANQNAKTGAMYKPFTAVSDTEGAYQIPRLPAGNYRVSAITAEQNLGLVPTESPTGLTLTLNDRETTELNLVMYGGATVTGRVFDKETDEPIADALIKTNTGSRHRIKSTTSTAEGQFLLSNVLPSYANQTQLNVSREGYSLAAANQWNPSVIAVEFDTESDVAHKDIPMMRTVTISGMVKNGDGVAIPTAKVKLWKREPGGTQEAPDTPVAPDGTYKIEVPRFETVRVYAEAPSYAGDFSEQIQIENDDVKDADVTLEPGATLTGIVVSPDDKPVEGANVTLTRSVQIGPYGHSQQLEAAITGPEGKFTLTNLPKKVRALAKKDGFASSRNEEITLEPAGVKSGVKLQLRVGHFIAGRALNSKGEPIEGVHINAHSSDSGESQSGSATTDIDGNYRIENLADIGYRVYGYRSNGGSSKQLEGVRVDRTDVDLIFEDTETRTLIGRVVDDRTGEPIKEFTVSNIGTVKKDRTPGRFTVEHLSPKSNYSASIEATGYPATQFPVTVPEEDVPFEKEFRLGPGGIVTGRLVRKGTSDPLPGVLVTAWSGNPSFSYSRSGTPAAMVKTDESGKFTLAGVPAGSARLTAKPPLPLAESTRSETIKNFEEANIGDWEIAAGATINGKLLRHDDTGVPQAEITIYNHSVQLRKQISTDANGEFTISGLTAGDYQLTVSPQNLHKSVKLADEETKEVTFRLGTSILQGRVTSGGAPVNAHISVGYTSADQEQAHSQSTRTNADGEYKFENLPSGKLTASAQLTSNYQSRRQHEITIPEGATINQDFALPNAQITGIVLDAGGAPVPTATVIVSPNIAETSGRASFNPKQTDASGKFTFEGLDAGSYSVTASKEGVGMARKGEIAITDQAPGYAELRLERDGGTLESLALDIADGQPIQRAWCYVIAADGQLHHNKTRGADGVVKIENIPPGTYTVQVGAWSYSQSEKTVEIRKGETTRIEDVLYAAGGLSWTITDSAGAPITNAKVTVAPLDASSIEEPRTGTTNSSGVYLARGLAPGNYSATAEIPNRQPVAEQFAVRASAIEPKTTKLD